MGNNSVVENSKLLLCSGVEFMPLLTKNSSVNTASMMWAQNSDLKISRQDTATISVTPCTTGAKYNLQSILDG